MAVKPSGSLSLITDIVGEFGGSTPHSLKEYYRNGTAGVTSNNTNVPESPNPLNMLSFYNAVKQFNVTITSSQKELNLYSYVTGLGWNGTDPIAVTVNSGVYLWSDNTSVGGLVISSAFNSKLTLTNYGYIIGRGGDGGGYNGGPALVNSASGVTLINQSGAYIAGGGGGGRSSGGGGGGGAGGGNGSSGWAPRTTSGGAGGAIGLSGGNAGDNGFIVGSAGGGAGGGGGGFSATGSGLHDAEGGGGGGRILPGVGGSGTIGTGSNTENSTGGNGGSGGDTGAYGQGNAGGGGGGWGADASGGGAGGAAISGTAIASLTNNGTIYGAVA